MKHVKNYSMTIFKSAAMALMFVLTFSSCKKDADKPAAAAVEGLYVGKYGFGIDTPDQDYKLNIKAGGIIQEIGINSGAITGEGTWQLNGNVFTAKYTMVFSPFNKYSISGTVNPSTGKLTGTWGGETDPTDGGKLDMTRQ